MLAREVKKRLSLFVLLLLFLFAMIAGCGPQKDRWEAPSLYLKPPSALQGTTLLVDVNVQDFPFDQCSNLILPDASSEEIPLNAIIFTNDKGEQDVKVKMVKIVDSQTMRLRLFVDANATKGEKQVVLECDQNTVLHGVFDIRERIDSPVLLIDPPAAEADSTVEVTISVDLSLEEETENAAHMFDEETSHIIFGDGTTVMVTNVKILSGQTSLKAKIEISALALDSNEASKVIDVAVVTGNIVASGKFTITKSIYSTIQVNEDFVYRPATDADNDQFSLTINGTGTSFTKEDKEIPSSGTVISFPDNPGIVVDAITYISSDYLKFNISVDELAHIGATSLLVESGGEIAATDFTVLAKDNDSLLTLEPGALPAGMINRLVLAKVVNFSIDETSLVTCFIDNLDCAVEQVEKLSDDMLAIWLSMKNFTMLSDDPINAVLNIKTGEESVEAYLLILQENPLELNIVDSLVQGHNDIVVLKKTVGSFTDSALASVSDRSGILLPSQVSVPTGLLLDSIQVAKDAPVGPSVITVKDGLLEFKSFFDITASDGNSNLIMSPQLVLPGPNTTILNLKGKNLTFTEETTVIVDDPAVAVDNITVNKIDNTAQVKLAVGPAAKAGITNIYVKSSNEKAAASYRSLQNNYSYCHSLPFVTIDRQMDATKYVFVTLENFKIDEMDLVAQVFDDIGIKVERILKINSSSVQIALTINPESTLGGWFGIVIANGLEDVVVPVHILGDDQSLTMQLSPDEISPGDHNVMVTATVSQHATLDKFTSKGSSIFRSYVSIVKLLTNNEAQLRIDIAYDAKLTANGLPVYLTTQKGAAVGFLTGETLIEQELLLNSEPLDIIFSDNNDLLVHATPAPQLTRLQASFGEPDALDLNVKLLAQGALFAKETATKGALWILGSDSILLAVSPDENPNGDHSTISLIQKGSDEDVLAPFMIYDNPCAKPQWNIGNIKGALYKNELNIGINNCDLAAVVVSRKMLNESWATPDLKMSVCNIDQTTCEESLDWPHNINFDPRLFFENDSDHCLLVIEAEMATSGMYMINVRGNSIIREVSREISNSYIILEMEPGTSLEGYSIVRLDPDLGQQSAILSLTGIVADSGIVVIADADEAWVDIKDTQNVTLFSNDDSFIIRLQKKTVLDSIQVGGTFDPLDHDEGDAIDNLPFDCFTRLANTVDTNDNQFDFVGGFECSP